MIGNRAIRFMPSAPVVADLLSMTTMAFPTWAVLVSSVYLIAVGGLHSAFKIAGIWKTDI
jgi:hypothetical protein